MRLSRTNRSSFARAARLVGLGAVLAVSVVAIGAAFGSTTIKKFEASIGAPGVPSPAAQTYTFTLTNHETSNQTLGSANVTVPGGYVVDTSTFAQTVAGGTKQWRPPLLDTATRQIQLRALDARNGLPPKQSLVLTFSATASCSVATGPWQTDVKQSNNFLGAGNDFVGISPSLTVTGTGVVRFEFATIGPYESVGRAFGVTVTAKDACGQTAPFNGTAMLSGLNGVAPQLIEFSAGIATATLTPVQQQDDAQLRVDAASDPSNTFDVVTELCTSEDPEAICEASDAARTTTVTTNRPPAGATMALTFSGLVTQFSCDGGRIDTRGALARIEPAGYTRPIALTTRWDKAVAPGTGVTNFVFCMSKDGVSYTLVTPCTKTGELPVDKPFCELKRNRNGVGDLLIQYLISPNDPWGGLG